MLHCITTTCSGSCCAEVGADHLTHNSHTMFSFAIRSTRCHSRPPMHTRQDKARQDRPSPGQARFNKSSQQGSTSPDNGRRGEAMLLDHGGLPSTCPTAGPTAVAAAAAGCCSTTCATVPPAWVLNPWVPAPNSFMVALPNRMAPRSFRTATQGASAVTDNLQERQAQTAEQTSRHHVNRCHQQRCMTVDIKLNVRP